MLTTIVLSTMMVAASPAGPGSPEVASLLATIESLQQPLDDFGCEFEGRMQFMGRVAESSKAELGEDGIAESFSGSFLWRRGGDVRSDSLHRRGSDNKISRETLVIRASEGQAELYDRMVDTPLGQSVVQKPKDIRYRQIQSVGRIFLIDDLRSDVADDIFEAVVHDDQLEGRPHKVVDVSLKTVPKPLMLRYWIDLSRNGHVVRQESFGPDKTMNGRADIKLESFKIGNAEMWMPVRMEQTGWAAMEKGSPIVTKEPTSLQTVYIVAGTMVFNRHPGRDAFTIKYKPGTPVSDHLRQMETEFGQQKIGLKPTKVEAEKMLKEQLKQAEEQKSELVAVPTSGGVAWSSWALGGFAALAVASVVAFMIQNRRH